MHTPGVNVRRSVHHVRLRGHWSTQHIGLNHPPSALNQLLIRTVISGIVSCCGFEFISVFSTAPCTTSHICIIQLYYKKVPGANKMCKCALIYCLLSLSLSRCTAVVDMQLHCMNIHLLCSKRYPVVGSCRKIKSIIIITIITLSHHQTHMSTPRHPRQTVYTPS